MIPESPMIAQFFLYRCWPTGLQPGRFVTSHLDDCASGIAFVW